MALKTRMVDDEDEGRGDRRGKGEEKDDRDEAANSSSSTSPNKVTKKMKNRKNKKINSRSCAWGAWRLELRGELKLGSKKRASAMALDCRGTDEMAVLTEAGQILICDLSICGAGSYGEEREEVLEEFEEASVDSSGRRCGDCDDDEEEEEEEEESEEEEIRDGVGRPVQVQLPYNRSISSQSPPYKSRPAALRLSPKWPVPLSAWRLDWMPPPPLTAAGQVPSQHPSSRAREGRGEDRDRAMDVDVVVGGGGHMRITYGGRPRSLAFTLGGSDVLLVRICPPSPGGILDPRIRNPGGISNPNPDPLGPSEGGAFAICRRLMQNLKISSLNSDPNPDLDPTFNTDPDPNPNPNPPGKKPTLAIRLLSTAIGDPFVALEAVVVTDVAAAAGRTDSDLDLDSNFVYPCFLDPVNSKSRIHPPSSSTRSPPTHMRSFLCVATLSGCLYLIDALQPLRPLLTWHDVCPRGSVPSMLRIHVAPALESGVLDAFGPGTSDSGGRRDGVVGQVDDGAKGGLGHPYNSNNSNNSN
eukprot:CAMPEP_0175040478 /NCGR_PEP_ID=MMETSP0052_2-20121109/1287_1 /TAXON_ID=51329 ORGANISM="Polytomella parva, Strain SAG 63-3" /NCGR_SAMPLE_ID=MMETSP0052_2 /ASSEMBLY_ACC=CAM_ASM_000194 /LENGTH=526 /DNA_ID=CAMNT_0016302697 /DNA_START=901 /DNA_END=2478 /DNA_ORIENTATION=-